MNLVQGKQKLFKTVGTFVGNLEVLGNGSIKAPKGLGGMRYTGFLQKSMEKIWHLGIERGSYLGSVNGCNSAYA